MASSTETNWRELPQECLERVLELGGAQATSCAAQVADVFTHMPHPWTQPQYERPLSWTATRTPSHVCREWRSLAESEDLWRRLVRDANFKYDRELRGARESYRYSLRASKNWATGTFEYAPWPLQHNTWITCLAMENENVVTGSNDRSLVVWDRHNKQWSHILKGHVGQLTCAALQGSHLVSAARDRTVRVWDFKQEAELFRLENPTNDVVNGVAMNQDVIVCACTSNLLHVFCARTGERIRSLEGHSGPVYGVTLHDEVVISGSVDRTARVWDLKSGQCIHALGNDTYEGITCVAADSNKLAAGDLEGIVRVWDVQTGEPCYELKEHTDWIRGVSMSCGRVGSTGRDGNIKVWDLARQPKWQGLQTKRRGRVLPTFVDSDDENGDGVASGTPGVLTINTHGAEMRCVAMDDAELIAGGKDGILHSWRFAPRDQAYEYQRHVHNRMSQLSINCMRAELSTQNFPLC